MIRRHALRGYDAVQLAAAILINGCLLKNQLPSLTFISADNRLRMAAVAEGLIADNPNFHP
ncbi:type II toxin-antitoxin system VapC family toxin [Candidatus Poribacteria bacterium]|nr:type II toxin-antitoxin system VapC family toxin [Candidatus Poribacteria bacterium]